MKAFRMILLNEILDVFTKTKFVYESRRPIEVMRDKVKYVINQREILDFKYNLQGEIHPDNTFLLRRRIGFLRFNSSIIRGQFKGIPILLKGKLIKQTEHTSTVELQMTIHPQTYVFLGVFLLMFLLTLGNAAIERKASLGIISMLFYPSIIGLTIWAIAKMKKKNKAEFEKALDIKPTKS